MKNPRDRNRPIKVYVNDSERIEIEIKAKQAGLTLSDFLRTIALKGEVKSHIDLDAMVDLMALNGNLGKIGGLLKIYLLDQKDSALAKQMLEQIKDLQQLIREKASSLRG